MNRLGEKGYHFKIESLAEDWRNALKLPFWSKGSNVRATLVGGSGKIPWSWLRNPAYLEMITLKNECKCCMFRMQRSFCRWGATRGFRGNPPKRWVPLVNNLFIIFNLIIYIKLYIISVINIKRYISRITVNQSFLSLIPRRVRPLVLNPFFRATVYISGCLAIKKVSNPSLVAAPHLQNLQRIQKLR